ncbi:hypothetical protein CH299_07260 [Rhodococcus sp. 14-2686-1-2]|nr:hypothetical protein CH301_06715 [Rhodococcus sp. 15-1189-1-1a]OZF18843.1 hypothetical protein CH299_07260 [Rhodococcus sp. 14-2686-1-2]
MITAHFSEGEILAKPFHVVPYFDGASAFVLLSGLLVGIVHRRKIDVAQSFRSSRDQLTRRVVMIYLCQLLISLVALALVAAGRSDAAKLDMADSAWQVVILRYLPPGGDVLSLYFVLMVAVLGLLPLMRAGYGRWVLAASLALYIAAVVAPYALWNYWASWQALFVPALVAGWYWTEKDIAARIQRRIVSLVAAAVVVAVVSIGFKMLAGDSVVQAMLIDKSAFGPGRLVVAWIFVPALYVVIRFLLGRLSVEWFRPLELAGTRSLDSYVIQACSVMLIPLVIALPWGTATETILALGVFGICWAWAEFRRRFGIDKLHRAPVAIRRAVTA